MKKLSAGDSVVSVGLVPYTQGQKRNYAIFKFGNFSNELDEPFLTGCDGGYPSVTPEKVSFVSINLSDGASGSPIFFVPPVEVREGMFRPVLIGVQSSSIFRADVAAMTPVGPIYKIIQDMDLPNADLRNDPSLSLPKPNPQVNPPQPPLPRHRPFPTPQIPQPQQNGSQN
jgi:hypothetical protein